MVKYKVFRLLSSAHDGRFQIFSRLVFSVSQNGGSESRTIHGTSKSNGMLSQFFKYLYNKYNELNGTMMAKHNLTETQGIFTLLSISSSLSV